VALIGPRRHIAARPALVFPSAGETAPEQMLFTICLQPKSNRNGF